MREYGFSLTHIFPYKDKLYESIQVSENPYSCIFYGVYFRDSSEPSKNHRFFQTYLY